ncbi:transposase domain-containing protein [Paraglaciecola sp. L3A3]|uniref:transposase domain-containing protein n=1 Tax=Paraglaciecola sp. L3A3 TaxID=2686358 RepID=UPI00131E6981|nr:transposase domain-containing protein [Paraglaciecola sp. L3A3]
MQERRALRLGDDFTVLNSILLGAVQTLFTRICCCLFLCSVVLDSIIETAKANGLSPFDYLNHLLEHISQPDYDIENLLPWNTNNN